MARGKPPWRPCTPEMAEDIVKKLDIARDNVQTFINESRRLRVESVSVLLDALLNTHLPYLEGWCASLSEKAGRTYHEIQAGLIPREVEQQQRYQKRIAAKKKSKSRKMPAK